MPFEIIFSPPAMKSIAIEKTKLNAADLASLAQAEPLVLTKRGQPVCAIIEIDDLDLEAWSLGSNPEFLALLEQSRKRLREEGGIPLDEVRRRLNARGQREPPKPITKLKGGKVRKRRAS